MDLRRSVKSWYVVIINALVGCSIAMSFPQFSMTITSLSAKSGISPEVLLTSDTVKSAGVVLAMMASGFFYKKFGARKVFLYSMITCIGTQFLFPFVTNVPLLMVLKVLQGSSSMCFPVFLVIIMNWIPEKDMGLSTAIFNGVFYSGGGIGGTIAGIVIANSNWVTSYYAIGVIQLAIGIVWILTIKEKPPWHVEHAEVPVENQGAKGSNNNYLKSMKLWMLALAFFATTWCVQAITVDMPIFGEALGYDELNMGKIMTAMTVGMILSCIVSGKISDLFVKNRKDKGRSRILILMIGQILIVASIVLLVLGDMKSFTLFFITVFLFTFASSWGLGTFYSILPEVYNEDEVSVVTGITGGIGDLGMPLSPLVVGVFFGIRGLWTIGWITCAAIGVLSLLASIYLITKKGLLSPPHSTK